MKYDFDTIIDRSKMNSGKWNIMKEINPNIDKNIVPLSVADMEFPTAPEIVKGLKEYIDNIPLGYTSPSYEYFREVINWIYKKHQVSVERDWVIPFGGIVPALFALIYSLTEPRDGVLILSPVYYPFKRSINNTGRTIVEAPLKLENNYYTIDYEELEEKAKLPSTKLLIFCNPHNPIGRVWKKEEMKKVADICFKYDVIIISDEIHNDLIMPGYKHTMFSSISEEISKKIIVCTAPSKTFNLAGMLTSNLIIRNEEYRNKLKSHMEANSMREMNSLGYEACRIAYSQCEGWLEELIKVLDRNKKLVENFVKSNLPGVVVYPLEGTYLQWLDFRCYGLDYKELEKVMQFEAQCFLDEGYIFGDMAKEFERINIACPTLVLEDALKRIYTAFKKRGLI